MSTRTFNSLSSSLKKRFNISWFQGFFTFVIYLVAASMITKEKNPIESFPQLFFYVFCFMAIVSGILFFIYNKILFPDNKAIEIIADPIDIKALARLIKPNGDINDIVDDLKKLEIFELKALALISNSYGHYVIRIAFAEFPAVQGMVLTILSHDITYVIWFSVYSLILKVIHRPNFDVYIQRTKYLIEKNDRI